MLPLSARGQADTVYTFRFVADGDMFHVPYGGNDVELARLERRVEELKDTSRPMASLMARTGR